MRHPEYTKPELLAERPNEVWSWDITKLKGPAKWTYYYLYVVLDIYSRRVVGLRWSTQLHHPAAVFRHFLRGWGGYPLLCPLFWQRSQAKEGGGQAAPVFRANGAASPSGSSQVGGMMDIR